VTTFLCLECDHLGVSNPSNGVFRCEKCGALLVGEPQAGEHRCEACDVPLTSGSRSNQSILRPGLCRDCQTSEAGGCFR